VRGRDRRMKRDKQRRWEKHRVRETDRGERQIEVERKKTDSERHGGGKERWRTDTERRGEEGDSVGGSGNDT